MAPIAILLRTVFESILEVVLLCLAGYVLARRGILDKRTQKQLNRLNVSLFTPSLLFSKVAFFLSPALTKLPAAKLRELWIIPLFFTIVTTLSMVVAYLLGWMFRLKRSQRSFAIAASMFMNSNSLPIALMQSLVITVPGLQWDEDDTKSAMVGRALTYLVLYSTLGMVLRWSYGVHLLSQADPEGTEMEASNGDDIHNTADDDESSPLLSEEGDSAKDCGRALSTVLTDTDSLRDSVTVRDDVQSAPSRDDSKLRVRGRDPNGKPVVFYSFPNTPTRSMVKLPNVSSNTSLAQNALRHNNDDDDDEGNDSDALALPSSGRRRPVATPTSSRFRSFLRRTAHRTKSILRTINDFMTVPLWAALLSLIVALIQPLQHTLDAHVQPIKGALTAAGNCSIPLTLVVLGAYFYSPASDDIVNGNAGTLPSGASSGHGAVNGVNPTSDDSGDASRRTSLAGSVKSMLRLTRLDKKASYTPKRTRPGETRTVIIAVLSRMLITPLLLFPLMLWAAKYDVLRVFDDPVFVLSNVLLVSSPPALTLAQITQAASGDAFERLISRTIFWAYCVVTPPATIIYVVIGLLLAKL